MCESANGTVAAVGIAIYLQRRKAFSLLELLVALTIAAVLMGLLVSAVMRVRNSASCASCANNLRQIGLALHSFHNVNDAFPPGTSGSVAVEPYPFVTWLARILPFVEQEALWADVRRAYAADRTFSHVPPHTARATVIAMFTCNADDRAGRTGTAPNGAKVAFTSYVGSEGVDHTNRNGILFLDSRIRSTEVLDGLSHTLIVGERPPSADERYGWWYAGIGQGHDGNADATLGVNGYRYSVHPDDLRCFRGPYRFGPGTIDNQCDVFHFWSLHQGGANFVFADGSTRFLRFSVEPLMPAFATRAGGEAVGLE